MSVDTINALNGAGNSVKSSGRANSRSGEFSDVLDSVSGQKTDLDRIFEAASREYHVPLNLLKAVARAESDFDPDAVSPCGAQGIMQLMPETAKGLGVTDAFDVRQNIMGGAKYLSQMLEQFGGDEELALAGYNAGPGSVAKYGGIPPYKETQNYVKKVMEYRGENITAGTVTGKTETAADPDTLLLSYLLMNGTSIGGESDGFQKMLLMQLFQNQMMTGLFTDTDGI